MTISKIPFAFAMAGIACALSFERDCHARYCRMGAVQSDLHC